jgi:hypothetical protein
MERDTDLILASYATLTPEALEALSPEERRKVNVMLDPTVEALADGTLKMSGAFGEETPAWEIEGTSRRFSPRADLPSSKTFGFDLVLRKVLLLKHRSEHSAAPESSKYASDKRCSVASCAGVV